MAYFNFKRLIEKYKTTFEILIPCESGYNDAGDWIEGTPTKTTMQGAIIAFDERKVYRSDGTLTEQDRVLYMLEPLNFALKGAKVLHKGKEYTISSLNENAEFTGVWSYTLKYNSVFDEGGE